VSAPATRTLAAIGVALAVSSTSCRPSRVSHDGFASPRWADNALLPPAVSAEMAARAALTVERPTRLGAASGAPHYTYRFWREESPVALTLNAVWVSARGVYAVGDGGTILRRSQDGAWHAEPSGTTRSLRAIVGSSDATPFAYAFGDGGVVVRLEPTGQWSTEESGVADDLTAATGDPGGRVFVVGRGGTLLEHEAGRTWNRVPTRSTADLRAVWVTIDAHPNNHGVSIEGLYAVGDRGAIVHCALRMTPPVCVPRPSPTHERLLDVGGGDAFHTQELAPGVHAVPWRALALAANGEVFAGTGFEPLDFVAAPSLAGDVGLRRYSISHHMFYAGDEMVFTEILAVGARGRIAFLTDAGAVPFTIPGEPDLFDVALDRFEVFAVGAHGALFHGVMSGLREERVLELSARSRD
jgi:hypothetical protein